ncbi:MAG: lipoyl synthase [Desulfomonile sp.]|nr:lipoyl synthase [Desulfomonile sp.]
MRSQRLPDWIRVKPPDAAAVSRMRGLTYAQGLSTVCVEARCPNRGECYDAGTATFLILGDRCTRNCTFCAVQHGVPQPVHPDEPVLVADAVVRLGLRHVVVTSVTRDDLPDGGAKVFAATIRALRKRSPSSVIEVLIPDFQGSKEALECVIDAGPDVIGHNLETVARLYPRVRNGASYARSIRLLRFVGETAPNILSKSGIMVGLGESKAELSKLFDDLVAARCRVLTIGQYLQPTRGHHPVERYLPPEEFAELRHMALNAGMIEVAAGPLVRSSYKAGEIFLLVGSPRSLLPADEDRSDSV